MNPFIILVSLVVLIIVLPAIAPLLRRKRADGAPAGAASRGPKSPTIVSNVPFFGGGIPEDFPVEGFLRNTMDTFVELQGANDRGDLGPVRTHLTQEMFDTLSGKLQARGGAPRHTEVKGLKADLLEVVDAGDSAVASVRLSGQLRADGGDAENFDEIWQVCKGLRDKGDAWVLAGIRPVT